jgi:glycine dehydrogenase subunit 1
MPFIPHTLTDVQSMLADLNLSDIKTLFDEIPKDLPMAQLKEVPAGLSEMELTRLMQARAPEHKPGSCFIGAGAYEHFIPAAVWDIVGRGEYYTAYTPYQAEASQGSLQLIYEYQSMMSHLMGMDVSNASLYDGSTALTEAILIAVRIKRSKVKKILIPQTVHPHYLQVLKTFMHHQDIELIEIPYQQKSGSIDAGFVREKITDGVAALIIAQPNFFGCIEEVDELTNLAHKNNTLVIASVNPVAMALLKEPGQWGEHGADIVCGEGQPLGVPLAGGGPYFGFMCCKKEFVRQLPGRIVGRTTDDQGREGFVLTLQAREQHIRRAKATSNICTNQGLMVVAATIYMSLTGGAGLQQVARTCHTKTQKLYQDLLNIKGVNAVFESPLFHEFVLQLDKPVADVLQQLSQAGIQGGLNLEHYYPELKNCLLVCVTETKTADDLMQYKHLFEKAIAC